MGTELTVLLNRASKGDEQALAEAYRLAEPELRKLARSRMRPRRAGQELESLMLVNDAFLKLVVPRDLPWESRKQFYAFANRVIWESFIASVRETAAQKRGGGNRGHGNDVVLQNVPQRRGMEPLDLLALDEALSKLEAVNPMASQIVKWHYLECTLEEIAELFGASVSTIKRRWRFARSWLRRELKDLAPDAVPSGEEHET